MKHCATLPLIAALIGTESSNSVAQEGEAAAAFRSASERLNDAIVKEFTGDPDVHFVMAMIPHYEGSIEMARIALEYGKDPQVRQLAEHVVSDHQAELEAMLEWIETDGGRL